MKEQYQYIAKKNNMMFLVIILGIVLYVSFHDKFFQYEDDKSFFSEFLRSSKYRDSQNIISSKEARGLIHQKSDLVIKAIKFRNFTLLKHMIHPKHGIRFSPYLYVMSTDIVFNAENIQSRFYGDYIYDWGSKRSNKNIKMSFSEYYRRYIYNHDYAVTHNITYNKLSDISNVIDNVLSFYPNSIIVEYYSDNQSDYEESLLRLVFEKHKDDWFLSGIITISN